MALEGEREHSPVSCISTLSGPALLNVKHMPPDLSLAHKAVRVAHTLVHWEFLATKHRTSVFTMKVANGEIMTNF